MRGSTDAPTEREVHQELLNPVSSSSRLSEDDFYLVRMDKSTAISNAANRLLFSKAYSIFYIVMILLNTSLVVWVPNPLPIS